MKLNLHLRARLATVMVCLMVLSQISIMEQIANAQILDVNLTIDKPAYSPGETVKISTNVTLDGILQNDTPVAIEVDFPDGNLFLIRTIETGDTSGGYWKVQILDLYTCDAYGNPKTLFSRDSLAGVRLKIKNMDVVKRHVLAALYTQCSDNTPLPQGAFYAFEMDVEGGEIVDYIKTLPISSDAPIGEATVFASLFTDRPRNVGTPQCPGKKANFYIETTVPLMPPQPQYCNLTFALPQQDLPRGNYKIYGTTRHNLDTEIKIKPFTVEGPVPIITYYPSNPIACQTITFDGSDSYDINGTVTDWYWEFGDGTAKGPIVTHVYETAGDYMVGLTVTDNNGGTNSTARLVTVLEAWPMFHHDPRRWGDSTSLAPVTNITKWILTIGPTNTDSWMYSSPAVIPAIAGEAVFIGSTNGTIYAFNATSGAVKWAKTPAPGYKFYSSPAFADDLVFIGSEDGHIYALNATNGNTQYSITTGNPVYSSSAAVGNRVYVGSQDMKVYAFYTNGTSIWTSNALDGAIYSSPANVNGKVFVGTWHGTVYALNETTSAVIWSTNLTPNKPIYSSPAFAYGTVFIGSTDKTVYALNAENGSILWSYPTSGEIYSSPAVADGSVFIGSMDNNLYALDAATGTLKWSKAIGQIKWSSPLVAESKVFIGTEDGKLFALREKNGEVWWSYQTGGAVDSSPAVLNDILYASSKDGKLYAFTGQLHDVAVTNVTSSKTLVFQNETITINTVLWNKGSFNETVNLTASYNGTVFHSTIISLTRAEERTIQIPLNTTGVPAGNYTIQVNATLVPPIIDENPSDNTKTCQIRIEIGKHEINVTNVTPSTPNINLTKPIPMKNVVGQGYNVTIYVTVKNQGNFTEQNIHVDIYWSNSTRFNQTINSVVIPELAVEASVMFNLTWNTNGFAYGNYTISAYAEPVPGEDNRTNNMHVDGIVRVGFKGDVDGITPGVPDDLCNMRDIGYVAQDFGFKPSSPDWEPNVDIDNNGVVDMRDIGIACFYFNKTE